MREGQEGDAEGGREQELHVPWVVSGNREWGTGNRERIRRNHSFAGDRQEREAGGELEDVDDDHERRGGRDILRRVQERSRDIRDR